MEGGSKYGDREEVDGKRRWRAPKWKDGDEVLFVKALKKEDSDRIRMEEEKLAFARMKLEEDRK